MQRLINALEPYKNKAILLIVALEGGGGGGKLNSMAFQSFAMISSKFPNGTNVFIVNCGRCACTVLPERGGNTAQRHQELDIFVYAFHCASLLPHFFVTLSGAVLNIVR